MRRRARSVARTALGDMLPSGAPPRYRHEAPRADGDAGFTLLEILVVLTIVGLLIGLVAPAALRQLSGARVSVAKQSIERLSGVLDLYNLDIGSYPTTEQGLAALVKRPTGAENWNGPYLKGDSVPLDAWSRPYVYRSPSERAQHDYDLCSTGPNGAQTEAGMICNP
jgi:general secretion pathway protein G